MEWLTKALISICYYKIKAEITESRTLCNLLHKVEHKIILLNLIIIMLNHDVINILIPILLCINNNSNIP